MKKSEFLNLLKMKLGLSILVLSIITHDQNIVEGGKHQLKRKYYPFYVQLLFCAVNIISTWTLGQAYENLYFTALIV